MAKKKKVKRKMTLQEKLEQLKNSGALDSGTSDAFWAPKPGTHYLRVLPPVGEMDYFFEIVGRHWLERTPHICPNVTQEIGDACPLCEAAQAFFRGSKTDKEMGKKLNVRKQFWMNVLVREGKRPGGAFKGPYLFTPGVQIFDALVGLLADEDYADEILSITDGIDVRLVREGTGRTDTSYDVFPTRKMVLMNPDYEDEDDAWDWLEENASDIASDLEIPDYDDLDDVLRELIEGPDEEEDEVAYARKVSKKRKRKKKKRKPF